MNPISDEDKWLSVLAGRGAAGDDKDSRQAQRVRAFYRKQMEADLAQPDDLARQKRIDNMLAARGVFRPVAQAVPEPGLLKRLLDWLVPNEPGHAGRYALVATLAMAAVIGPSLWHQDEVSPGEDMSAVSKGGTVSKGNPAPATAPGGFLVLVPEAPAAAAQALREQLAALGVDARVEQVGDEHRLTATIPAALRDSVTQVLNQAGLPPLAGDELNLRYQRLP